MKRIFLLACIAISIESYGQVSGASVIDRGITEMQIENYQKALSLFNQAISSNPRNADALQYRAFTRLKLKNYLGTLTDINKAISVDSVCATCYEIRAELKYRMNDLNGCIADYERAFRIEPTLANGENFYLVAKSKLVTKPKPSLGPFQPSAAFVEKIITTKLTFTDFYNHYYDYIESYTDANSLSYNEQTNQHDIPVYTAEVVCNYKGTKINFTLNSRTDEDPITDVTVGANCVCEWFSNWKNLLANGFLEEKRYDKNGVLEIWGQKRNLKTQYSLKTKSLEKKIIMWTE